MSIPTRTLPPRALLLSAALGLLALASASPKAAAQAIRCHMKGASYFSPDSGVMFIHNKDTIEIWDLERREKLHALPHGRLRRVGVCSGAPLLVSRHKGYIPDDEVLTKDKSFIVWDWSAGKMLRQVTPVGETGDEVEAMAVFPSGKSVAVADGETHGHIRIWDLQTGRQQAGLRAKQVRHLAVSPDGTRLAATGYQFLCVWDLRTNTQNYRIQASSSWCPPPYFSPNGQSILLPASGLIRVFDAETGEKLSPYRGLKGWGYNCLDFSSDGSMLAAGSRDMIHIWNVPLRRLVMVIQEPILGRILIGAPTVQRVSFLPDGKSLFSVNGDDQIHVWSIAESEREIEPESIEPRPIGEDLLDRAIGHYTGTLGQMDWPRARTLFVEAFQTGDPLAVMWAAHLLNRGRCGFERYEPDAERCADAVVGRVEEMAKDGNVEAQFLYGAALIEGLGVARNRQEGTKWYRAAAQAGHLAAMNNLGVAYARGTGVIRDDIEAVRWYFAAAQAGEAAAAYNLGQMIDDRRGVITRDRMRRDDTLPWHGATREDFDALKAARAEGGKEQMDALAEQFAAEDVDQLFDELDNPDSVYIRDIDADKVAYLWFRHAAEAGCAASMAELGSIFYFGESGLGKDVTLAREWGRKGAEAGNAAAAAILSMTKGSSRNRDDWYDRPKMMER